MSCESFLIVGIISSVRRGLPKGVTSVPYFWYACFFLRDATVIVFASSNASIFLRHYLFYRSTHMCVDRIPYDTYVTGSFWLSYWTLLWELCRSQSITFENWLLWHMVCIWKNPRNVSPTCAPRWEASKLLSFEYRLAPDSANTWTRCKIKWSYISYQMNRQCRCNAHQILCSRPENASPQYVSQTDDTRLPG